MSNAIEDLKKIVEGYVNGSIDGEVAISAATITLERRNKELEEEMKETNGKLNTVNNLLDSFWDGGIC